MRIYRLINRERYKGKGRPREIDYNYFKTKKKFMVGVIGSPIIPNMPEPTLDLSRLRKPK